MPKQSLMGMIDQFMDQEELFTLEGPTGVRNFTKLIQVLGYDDITEFLEDNSGAIEQMVEWIGSQNETGWVDAFAVEVMEHELDDEDEDFEEDEM